MEKKWKYANFSKNYIKKKEKSYLYLNVIWTRSKSPQVAFQQAVTPGGVFCIRSH